jgi:uncharacterized membrane protein
MATLESQIQIGASPEQVFAFIADLEKHPQWSHCMEIAKTSEGPVGAGTTYQSKGKNFGMTSNEKVEVTAHEPNDRFAWESTGAFGWKFNWAFELQPQEGGTLLTERFEPPKGLAGGLINTLAAGSTRKAMQQGLDRIKETLEAG